MIASALLLIWQKTLFIAIGLTGLTTLIVLHELGHFLFCKVFSIHTPSFSIGFGPVLISRQIGTTLFKFCAIPLGGYVEMASPHDLSESMSSDQLFENKPYAQKFLVMTGGILANLLFAYTVIIGLCILGFPPQPTTHLQRVVKDSAADRYGLQKDDMILSINQTTLNNNVPLLANIIAASANQRLTVSVLRNQQVHQLEIVPDERVVDGKSYGDLGIEFAQETIKASSLLNAMQMGIAITHEKIIATIAAFGTLFSRGGFSKLVGPIGIISLTTHGAAQGGKILLLLLAMISINLAVLNLIPLPILDGGQILFYTLEAITQRKFSTRTREYIHIATWILMLVLFVYLSAKDIIRIIGPYVAKIISALK